MNDSNMRVLTADEATAFRIFERHRMTFEALLKADVFTAPPSCKIEINMHNGQVQNVYIHTQTYRRNAQ